MTTFKRCIVSMVATVIALGVCSLAYAYSIKYSNDGNEAKVYCDNGDLAGTFYWNGTQWSNGVNSGPDIDMLAKKQVALNGSYCR